MRIIGWGELSYACGRTPVHCVAPQPQRTVRFHTIQSFNFVSYIRNINNRLPT